MIADPGKFHAILISKDQSVTSGVNLHGKSIKSEDSVELLGINLAFHFHFIPLIFMKTGSTIYA